MPSYAAFLRAVNVGGTGKLPMADLRRICEEQGFRSVRTYIASGNVVFAAKGPADQIRAKLEAAYAGKPVRVQIRSREELRALLSENPFPEVQGNRHLITLLDETPNDAMISNAKFQKGEVLRAGQRALHIHFPEGQGVSRLQVPGTGQGTARNRNTIEKIIEMLGDEMLGDI